MALQSGNYVKDTDLTNWIAGATDAQKLAIIEAAEDRVEKVTKDLFYPVSLDMNLDGNDKNRLHLNINPRILNISRIDVYGVEMSSSYYTWDDNAVYRDVNVSDSAELRWLLRQYRATGIFPEGINNIRVRGTKGWPQKLDFDSLVGTFEGAETITGGTSGATAQIKQIFETYLLIVGRSTTNFSSDEEITGGTSEATADVDNASGAVNNPPGSIKQACVKLCEYNNDNTLYTEYIEGSESLSSYGYTGKRTPLTGIREVDLLLIEGGYVRKKPMVGVI